MEIINVSTPDSGLGEKLRDAFIKVNENFEEVRENFYELKLKFKATEVNQTSGSLVIGKEYIIDNLNISDNFSNIGYEEEGVPFIATGTTPLIWVAGTVVRSADLETLEFKNTYTGTTTYSIDLTTNELLITNNDGNFIDNLMWVSTENYRLIGSNTLVITVFTFENYYSIQAQTFGI